MKIIKILILVIILFSNLVLAEETLQQGDSTTVGGRTFILVAV